MPVCLWEQEYGRREILEYRENVFPTYILELITLPILLHTVWEKRLLWIGMGNAAMDVARTALRNGAHQVTMYARGRRIAASSHEMAYAELDGAEFVFGKQLSGSRRKGLYLKLPLWMRITE